MLEAALKLPWLSLFAYLHVGGFHVTIGGCTGGGVTGGGGGVTGGGGGGGGGCLGGGGGGGLGGGGGGCRGGGGGGCFGGHAIKNLDPDFNGTDIVSLFFLLKQNGQKVRSPFLSGFLLIFSGIFSSFSSLLLIFNGTFLFLPS